MFTGSSRRLNLDRVYPVLSWFTAGSFPLVKRRSPSSVDRDEAASAADTCMLRTSAGVTVTVGFGEACGGNESARSVACSSRSNRRAQGFTGIPAIQRSDPG